MNQLLFSTGKNLRRQQRKMYTAGNSNGQSFIKLTALIWLVTVTHSNYGILEILNFIHKRQR